MKISYNVEKLAKTIRDFHTLTGISISVHDTQFRPLVASKSEQLHSFCNLIQSTPDGLTRCVESDCALLSRCAACRKPVTHRCHAGLTDTAVPIIRSGVLMGFILFGQVGEQKEHFERIRERLAGLDIAAEALERAYTKLTFFEREKIDSAAEVVSMLTKYVWLENMIRTESNEDFESILAYIEAHLTEPLTVAELCRRFNVSKNALYKSFAAQLGCTVSEHITKLRLERAERLLQTTRLPVYEICEQVGIDNYQYFCRLFKKKKGITPLGYRKESCEME